MILHATSPVPLYRQLYCHLRNAIENGHYQVGSRLPSERQLAAEYGISRLTARKALQLLHLHGYVEPKQGKGSFVVRIHPRRKEGRITHTPEVLVHQCG